MVIVACLTGVGLGDVTTPERARAVSGVIVGGVRFILSTKAERRASGWRLKASVHADATDAVEHRVALDPIVARVVSPSRAGPDRDACGAKQPPSKILRAGAPATFTKTLDLSAERPSTVVVDIRVPDSDCVRPLATLEVTPLGLGLGVGMRYDHLPIARWRR